MQQRRVEHGAGERTRRVERRGERHQAVPGRAAVGGLHADDAAHRGWLADGAAGVGADRERRLVGGDGGRRPAGRAAWDEAEVPGIVARPIGGVLGGRAHRELVHVRLAEDDDASVAQPPGDRRVVGRPPALEDLRPAGGRHVRGRHDVLERQRHAGQRAERLAGRALAIDVLGGRQRADARDVQEGVHVRVDGRDPVQVRLRHLDRGHLASRHGRGDLRGGQLRRPRRSQPCQSSARMRGTRNLPCSAAGAPDSACSGVRHGVRRRHGRR